MCAVSLAVLDVVSQPEFLQHVKTMGEFLRNGLEQLSHDHRLGEVRGEGLLLALELGHNQAAEVVHTCREQGLLVNAPRPHCLRLMPRLNSTEAEVTQGLEILNSVFKNWA